MEGYNVRLLRPDAQQIYIYNEAGLIYFYDQANSEHIKAVHPSILDGFFGRPEKDIDEPLIELGKKGMMVVLEPYQDDEFQAELSLKPPLTDSETGSIPWSKEKKASLSLPSGLLCIESMNSLRLVEDEPYEKGAYISVPPGNYVISIQALNPEYEQDHSNLLPEYYISLTPLLEQHIQPENLPFINYPYMLS